MLYGTRVARFLYANVSFRPLWVFLCHTSISASSHFLLNSNSLATPMVNVTAAPKRNVNHLSTCKYSKATNLISSHVRHECVGNERG